MSRLKQAVQTVGILAVLLCAAACTYGTTGAAAGNWRLNGANVTATLSPAVAVKEIENKTISILWTPGSKFEVLCTTLQPINVKLKPEGFVNFESQLKFSGCITKVNGTLSKACEPIGAGFEPGVIKTNLLKGVLIKHESSELVSFEPTSGTILASMLFGEECAIGEEFVVTGKFTFKDSAIETEAAEHLASIGPLTEIKIGATTVSVDGTMLFRLAGVHEGLKWSAGTTPPPPETPVWRLKGSDVTSALTPLVTVKELESEDAILSTKVGGAKVEVLCTGSQLSGMKLEPKGVISTGSKINFSGCLTKLNGVTSGACEPSNEGIEPGAIASKSLKGLLVEHEKSGLVRFEPTTGETLAVIETSKECSIGEKVSLLGKATFKDSALAAESETHLVSAGPLTELWLISKTEEHKVTLTGTSIVRLASSHAGVLWSGILPSSGKGWKVKGTGVTAALAPLVAVKEIESKAASFLWTTGGGSKLEVLCTTLQPINVKLEPEGFVYFESQLKFSGCVTKVNGVVSPACEPVGAGAEPGVVRSNLLKGALAPHESTSIVRFEPASGTALANMLFGEECAIGEEFVVTGKVTFKDSALGTEAVEHLASIGPLTEIKIGTSTVTIDGSIWFKLAGVHSGLEWSGSA